MRKAYQIQPTLRETWLDVEHSQELRKISDLLDEHPHINKLVLEDLRAASGATGTTGAGGMSAEQVLRALLIKQMNDFSYDELVFHLADSRSYRTFCRLGMTDKTPSKSALAKNIKALRAETLEAINRLLLGAAEQKGLEGGQAVRGDCTVVETDIHEPTDSGLLWDCVRTLTRLLGAAQKILGEQAVPFSNRTRRAKRRHRQISTAKSNKKRKRPYRDLLRVTEEVRGWALGACGVLRQPHAVSPLEQLKLDTLLIDLEHYLALSQQVIDQTRRRVLNGESVPAEEKIVSIFEEHTDIIRKDGRQTLYGHKIYLTAGASSLILDCVVLKGNPADSNLSQTMMKRQEEIFGRPPQQASFDGSFASKANLAALKEQGIQDVVFSKRRGLEISEMVKASSTYKKLRNFRAGIEGLISFLKRCFGLRRCTWRSSASFQTYVWGSILAANLLVMARHALA